MSQEAVTAFRNKVSNSPELQQQIRAGMTAKNLNLVALGKAHDCEFAADEVRACLDSAELSDFELEMVSGGTPIDCDKSNT